MKLKPKSMTVKIEDEPLDLDVPFSFSVERSSLTFCVDAVLSAQDTPIGLLRAAEDDSYCSFEFDDFEGVFHVTSYEEEGDIIAVKLDSIGMATFFSTGEVKQSFIKRMISRLRMLWI